jgi:dihydroflavonol-4-reductase
MKVLVTGATGFIGFHVARLLRENDFQVRALVRKGSDTSGLRALGVEPVAGDVRDPSSIADALEGCRQLYHLAADYRIWVNDPKAMYEINVQGTRNVMQAALAAGTEKVVYTSTVGVLASCLNGKPSNEDTPVSIGDMIGHYKRSKFLAEKEVCDFIRKGLPVVIVNPTTPVGAMDRRPTPTGKIIVDFLNGEIPAYLDTGMNFVDVEDVAAGHLLAAEHGRIGQRYILGNRNISLKDFFACLAGMAGRRPPRVRLPYFPVLVAAYFDETLSRITHKHPRVPLTGVRMARKYMYFDCSKAVRELRMPQNPVERALEKAIEWFRNHGYIKSFHEALNV